MATLRMSLAQSTGKPARRVAGSQWLVARWLRGSSSRRGEEWPGGYGSAEGFTERRSQVGRWS